MLTRSRALPAGRLNQSLRIDGDLKRLGLYPYTACFNLGDALNLTVLRAFTLMGSPVRGLRAFPAFILRTVKVPKLGKVNFPVFFSSCLIACIRSPAARVAAAPRQLSRFLDNQAIKALDILFLMVGQWVKRHATYNELNRKRFLERPRL
jgi:hypothetical protein